MPPAWEAWVATALLSAQYTFSCWAFVKLRTSEAPSMAKPTILTGHKAALFPTLTQSIYTFIYMLSICTSTAMLSPGSTANDPLLIKSYCADLYFSMTTPLCFKCMLWSYFWAVS